MTPDTGYGVETDQRRTAPVDRSVRAMIWRVALLAISGVVVVVALTLSLNDPEVTYTPSSLFDVSDDVTVTCDGDVGSPLIVEDYSPVHYKVTKGEAALETIEEQTREEGGDPAAISRRINADCAVARTSRLSTAMAIGGSGFLIALAAVAIPALVRRFGRT
ncbi:MAG TPA: hypothetical protein VK059_08000 [Nocardioidaceae bacterium]|nr:hypothetical protein [Nocardioidaceae bacterium]